MEMRGTVRGRRVELERAVPNLEGQRVKVRLEPLAEDRELTPDEQAEAWQHWVRSGPQGPIEDDADGWP